MKKPIPKSMENKIKKYVEHQTKANRLDYEIRHWLYKNNYDIAMVDMLIDSGQNGNIDEFIDFLNGKPNEDGQVIDDFYNDNSKIDESNYI